MIFEGVVEGMTCQHCVASVTEEVAELAGVSVDYVIRLEQGRGLRPSPEVLDALAGALEAHSGFQTAAWPEVMMRPHFCRYEVGNGYGAHVDAAIMGEAGALIRCDVATTVCLNDPAEYDGGELVIDTAGVPTTWKGRAGAAIVYSANTLHRVEPVTRGVRIVAVTWIQSMVRDGDRRRILFDLKSALDAFDALPTPPAEADAIRRSYFNLIRMWA